MKTFTPSVSKAQTKVADLSPRDGNRSFTAQWRLQPHSLTHIHSRLFCPFTKPWTSLRDTFWLHVAFWFLVLLHVDIFIFSFLCLIIRILLSRTSASYKEQTQTCRRRFTRICIWQQRKLEMWFWLLYGNGVWRPERGEVALDTGSQRKSQRGTKDWEEFCNRWRRSCWSDKEQVGEKSPLGSSLSLLAGRGLEGSEEAGGKSYSQSVRGVVAARGQARRRGKSSSAEGWEQGRGWVQATTSTYRKYL